MKVFITGSEGFIGSHLTEKLVQKNYDVICLVQYNSFNSWGWLDRIDPKIKKNMKVITGDIRDSELINQIIKKNKVDCIINLAALIGIPYSYRAPKSYFDTNVNGVMNLLNASNLSSVKKIIHTSTSEVYGTPTYLPIDEDHPVSAQSPYAASKIAADQLALSYQKSFGTPVSIIRPFNTFGPRQSARAIIPTIITQILKNKKTLSLGSLHPTRDLTYIDDTTEAFLSMIKSKKGIGEVTNIGSGSEISVKDLVKKISSIMGVKVLINKERRRIRPKNSEVLRLCASIKKAQRILKWKPKYSSDLRFQECLKKTIDWFLKNRNLEIYKSNLYND